MCKAQSQVSWLTLTWDTVSQGYFSAHMFKARDHCRSQYQSSVICNQKHCASYHLPRDMYQGLEMHCWSSHLGGATVGARDLAKHPTTNKAISTTKNCPAKNINNAEIEKPCHSPSKHQDSCCVLVILPNHLTKATVQQSATPQKSWVTKASQFQKRSSWEIASKVFLCFY